PAALPIWPRRAARVRAGSPGSSSWTGRAVSAAASTRGSPLRPSPSSAPQPPVTGPRAMSQQTWMLYAVMVFFMSATPGPNMLLALNHGIRHGFRSTLMTCFGLMTGLFLIMLGSVAGLGAILAASQVAFSIVKYAGALYLVYIGFRTWRASPRVERPSATGPARGNR